MVGSSQHKELPYRVTALGKLRTTTLEETVPEMENDFTWLCNIPGADQKTEPHPQF